MSLIKSLTLKFGATAESSPLECALGTVTVFVGPNNSGKSRALLEVAQGVASSGIRDGIVVSSFEISFPEEGSLQDVLLKRMESDMVPLAVEVDVRMPSGEFESFMRAFPHSVHALNLIQRRKLDPGSFGRKVARGEAASEDEAARQVRAQLVAGRESGRLNDVMRKWSEEGIVRLAGYSDVIADKVIVLDGAKRLSLVDNTGVPDWRNQDGNHLVNLLRQPERIQRLREVIRKVFGFYPVIDTTSYRDTKLKMARDEPGVHERSSAPESLQYFDEARYIHSFSDGVKSFVGILAAVLGNDYKLVLIDEPEAFLHPPLAGTLGKELHRLARERRSQVIASTHSPDFLMGCIQASPDVSIIRLTYKNEQPTARLLSFESLKKMMRDPLLRSTGVLGALFHEGAIVCESDSDRAFYQEVNERLLAEERGVQGCAFLNAQNKQTINRIISPLREMGIPAAAIVDLDVVGRGEELGRLLDAARVGPAFRASMLTLKKSLFDLFQKKFQNEDEAKKHLKSEGLRLLSDRERREFQQTFFGPLEQHGIFIVPGGELESWLPNFMEGVGHSDKAKWLTKIFERMGSDPDSPDYVRPGRDDVWAFVDRIAAWISSPSSGIPPGD